LRRRGSAAFEQLQEQGITISGTPDSLQDGLEEYQRDMQFGILVPLLQFVTMPHDRTIKSM